MRVLVAGGAGYIGSHTVIELIAAGHTPVIADNFVNSKPSVVPRLESLSGHSIATQSIDLRDFAKTEQLFAEYQPDAVIHFGGLKAVGESAEKPLEYYQDNLGTTLSLLNAMRHHNVTRFVFSSSATVYGEHAPVPYVETFEPLCASSPYGSTKVMIERILADIAAASSDGTRASQLKIALLRYFNPVGAHPSGDIGEDPQGTPNNLMPFIAQVAVGRRSKLSIFGNDYPTADGTCERDYIHVMDLAAGHVAALDHLDTMPDACRAFNLGSGTGTSVLQLLHAFEQAVGRSLPFEFAPRRAGDLPAFWADPTRAATELGWRTTRSVPDMCADTWLWQSKNPNGYQ